MSFKKSFSAFFTFVFLFYGSTGWSSDLAEAQKERKVQKNEISTPLTKEEKIESKSAQDPSKFDNTSFLKLNLKESTLDNHFQFISEILSETKRKTQELEEEKIKLEKALKEADHLIGSILDPNITVTTLNFLRGVYQKDPEEKIQELYELACNKKEIGDIIVGGHTKFKGSTPSAHRSILELAGFLKNMNITESWATIEYGRVVLPGTPTKKLDEFKDGVVRSKDREEKSIMKKLDFSQTSCNPFEELSKSDFLNLQDLKNPPSLSKEAFKKEIETSYPKILETLKLEGMFSWAELFQHLVKKKEKLNPEETKIHQWLYLLQTHYEKLGLSFDDLPGLKEETGKLKKQ